MADVLKKIYLGTPGTVSSTLYTVPASTTTIVKSIIACNDTEAAATLTIKVGGKTIISSNALLAAGQTVSFTDLGELATGDLIEGSQGTASAINVWISGMEVS